MSSRKTAKTLWPFVYVNLKGVDLAMGPFRIASSDCFRPLEDLVLRVVRYRFRGERFLVSLSYALAVVH